MTGALQGDNFPCCELICVASLSLIVLHSGCMLVLVHVERKKPLASCQQIQILHRVFVLDSQSIFHHKTKSLKDSYLVLL